MSKPVVVVFGATGNQGGSVADYLLSKPDLSRLYSVRAAIRDPSKPAAQALAAKGAELVAADASDPPSLRRALADAHAAFLVTTTMYGPEQYATELAQGRAMADAAVAAGVSQVIFSTLPSIRAVSGGKYVNGTHFDVKADIEAYIRTLPVRSAFFAPGSFMQNFRNFPPRPVPDAPGTFALAGCVAGSAPVPLVDAAGDTGKWVAALLAEPERYDGKVLCAATRVYTWDEVAAAMTKATGKTVVYTRFEPDVFRSFMPPAGAEAIVEMFLYQEEFGYYGPGQAAAVERDAKVAREMPVEFSDYLAREPLQLQ